MIFNDIGTLSFVLDTNYEQREINFWINYITNILK